MVSSDAADLGGRRPVATPPREPRAASWDASEQEEALDLDEAATPGAASSDFDFEATPGHPRPGDPIYFMSSPVHQMAPEEAAAAPAAVSAEPPPAAGQFSGQSGGLGAAPFNPDMHPIDTEKEASGLRKVVYKLILFFAYWFGANRFENLQVDRIYKKDMDAYLRDLGLRGQGSRLSPEETVRRDKKRTAKARSESGDQSPTSVAATSVAEDTSPAGESIAESGVAGAAAEEGRAGVLEELARVEVTGQEVVDRIEKMQLMPTFIILQVLLIFGFWVPWVIIKQMDSDQVSTFNPLMLRGGFDDFFKGGLSDGPTDLRVAGSACEDYRLEVYRWFTYQWTHVSAVHVVLNCVLLIIFGVPLNGLFGFVRTFLLHTSGVIGGALCYFWWDAHTPCVGTSGGIYCFIGVHIADYFLNFRSKRFRCAILLFIIILVAIDCLSYFVAVLPEYTSAGPHLGGFIAGLVIGGFVYGGQKRCYWPRVLAGLLGAAFVGFSVYWVMTVFAPRNIREAMAGTPGWCWTRQFWDPTIDEFSWLCIKCGTQECIDKWSQQRHLMDVRSLTECSGDLLQYGLTAWGQNSTSR